MTQIQQVTSVCTPGSAIEGLYRERRERFGREHGAVSRRWNAVANARLLVFLGAAACGVWALAARAVLPAALTVALFAGFVALVVWHGRLGAARRRSGGLWQLNDEALHRLARAWRELPPRHTLQAEPDHPYAADLDLFGSASLFHLLERPGSGRGEETLARWLLEPAGPETVRERQEAVRELAPLLDLRDELALRGRPVGEARPDPEPFLSWAEATPWLRRQVGLVWCARISPLLLWALVIAQVAGWVAWPLWLVFLVPNFLISRALGQEAYRALQRVWTQERAFRHYAALFELIASARFAASLLRRLQERLAVGGSTAHQQMQRLHRLASLSIPRTAQLYVLIQLFTLWDIHAAWLLEGWQRTAGRHARGWLEALGEIEALAALAALAHDNPHWTFPVVEAGANVIEAHDLGHPLIPDGVRVTNDVTVGPAGSFLLVTGSNMSGKSTLLRAIGVNLVLAGAGGPVCASSLRCPPVVLWTAMRVQDSLTRGVSYFMAELQRLKAVVDAAHRTCAVGDRAFVYLLDEILQGTNTAERQIAARHIILHLVAEGALGAVSTHDLTLADTPEVAAAARPVHFTETVHTGGDGPSMTFDYKLRPGIATSTNALRLMQLVGLDLDEGR